MSHQKALILVAGLAAGLLGGTGDALADDLQRVEISGKAVRHDVSKACPGVAQALQDSLGYVAWREGTASTVRMSFRLTGKEVDAVQASSGPFAYRQAARRAVHQLECADANSAQPQDFTFLISFNPPSDDSAAAAPSRLALLER